MTTSSHGDAESAPRSPLLGLVAVFGSLVVARLAFMRVMPPGAHSTDIDIWIHIARVLEAGGNPYNETTLLKYPPLWMIVIFSLERFSRATGLSLFGTLQLFFIAADCGIAAGLLALLRRFQVTARIAVVVIGLSLNPVSILLSCQHGNHDVLLGLWVLLAVMALVRWRQSGDPVDWLAACAFLGVGVLQKTVPIVLAPLLLAGASKLRPAAKALGAGLVVGPALLGLATIYTLGPAGVSASVFGYRSYAGFFGFTGLASLVGQDALLPHATTAFLLVLVAIGAAVARLASRFDERDLVLAAFVLLSSIVIFGPGYGPQYASWFLPLLVAIYPLFGRRFGLLVLVLYGIATATYVVEYALVSTQGAFLTWLRPVPWVLQASERVGTQGAQTLLRLPLFLAYVAVFVAACRILARTRIAPQAASESAASTNPTSSGALL